MQQRLDAIKNTLDANKAENIETYDLQGTDYMVDGVVIATAMVDKHLLALLDFLKKDLKGPEQFLHVDTSDEWIVVDMGDILVHLMTESARAKYHLEAFMKQFEEAKRKREAQA